MTHQQRRQYLLEAAFNIVVTFVPSHVVRQAWLRTMGVGVGKLVSVFRGVTVQGAERILLEDGVVVGWHSHLDGRGGLHIGRDVAIAQGAMIVTAEHDYDSPYFVQRNAPVRIGRRAWIATRATILPGVEIGEGAVVAAGAVVCKDVGSFSIVGGVPARPIGARTRDLRYQTTLRSLFQ